MPELKPTMLPNDASLIQASPTLFSSTSATPTPIAPNSVTSEPPSTSPPIALPRRDTFLPAEPVGACDPELVKKLNNFHLLKMAGKSLNESLRKSKPFRNPDILEKLVLYCKINEIGSNYPLHLFNPNSYQREDFYDAISVEQKEFEEKRDQERVNRTQIEFTTGVMEVKTSQDTNNTSKNKKSKWDNMEPILGKSITNPTSSIIIAPPSSGGSYSNYIKQRQKREAELIKAPDNTKKQKQ